MAGYTLLSQIFTWLDAIALAYFTFAVTAYRIVIGREHLNRLSLGAATQAHRVAWMSNMAMRGDHRTMDIILLNSVVQGNAFFASTTAIAIGGISALIGSGDRAQAALERLPYVYFSNPILWEIKLCLIIAVFIFAFFKFAWAFRLGHYTAIMIGATPMLSAECTPEQKAVCNTHAERAARLAGLSAEHANAGLRSFYYAIAAMAWFFHPIAFMVATTWIILIQSRRDFLSRSLDAISGPRP